MFRNKVNCSTLILLMTLFFTGFWYRIYGLNNNYSFWTDETHVAIFVRAILERGRPVLTNGYSTGAFQWLQYWLSAISAKIFGLNEFAIRFPSVAFGVLTILVVYLLGKELFNRNVGLISAAFITFLKIEILWSRQARPYQAIQFFLLLGAYFIYKLSNEKNFNWRYFLGFSVCGILALLMHGLGLVLFFLGFLYILLSRPKWFKREMWLGLVLPIFLIYIFRYQIYWTLIYVGKIDNLFYYRVFIWQNYRPLFLLAILGFFDQILRKNKAWGLLSLFLVTQGLISSFFLGQPFVRYVYIVFPFFILFSAAGLELTGDWFVKLFDKHRKAWIGPMILIFLTFFTIGTSHKLTLKPLKIYSLNEDMQEIPEIDWKKFYQLIGSKLEKNSEIVLVTNWNDLPVWFLGEGKTEFWARSKVSLFADTLSGAQFATNLEDFKKIMVERKRGLIIVDSWDNYFPEEIREYAQKNLQKELEVDRLYPVQPRYWPVTVYSWGLD